jgi:outer membrane receptor protein involved in Fe transport
MLSLNALLRGRPARTIALLLATALAAFAAAPATRSFDVPGGDAAQSLRLAAQQAGREIMFLAETVRGTRTAAVKGQFTAEEALRRMLAGTDLQLVQDDRSGALAVKRADAPANAPSAPAPRTSAGQRQADELLATDTIVMTPFTVATERDEGFVAATSLAGGRLTTELRDTPLAYSVLTRDFLDTLALFDQEQALTWSVGSYMPLQDTSTYRYNDNEAGSSVMSRGVRIAGAAQRNFFQLGLNADTYSQERIDFARGPNALLIGTGGLGGVVVGMTKRARPDKAFDKAGLVLGSWNRFRTTYDVNRPLNDKLAFRANLLWQDADTWRNLEFDNRRGNHYTLTYRPFRRTQVRAEFEYYKQSTIMGRETLSESLSGWDGRTVVTAPQTQALANADALGLARFGSNTAPQLIYIPGTDGGTVMNWANSWRTQGGGANAAVPVGGRLPLLTANLGINNGPMIDSVYSGDLLFRLSESGSAFRRPTRETVLQPDAPTLSYEFRTTAVFVEHQQGEHLFFEAAANWARTRKQVEAVASRLGSVFVDVNATLPDGRPNPNFLQPYSEAISGTYYYLNNIKEARAAAALVFDRTRFGDFRANLIAGGRAVHNDVRGYGYVMNRSADIRARSRDDLFNYRYYLNDPVKPFTIPTSVRLIDPVTRTDTTYGVTKILDIRSAGNFRASDTTFTYLQGALNAKLFNGRLNLLGGARRDTLERDLYTLNGNANAVIADYPANWDGQTPIYRPLPPSDYWNLSYRAKDASGAITGTGATLPALSRPRDASGRALPQYANDRFRDDYSSPPVDFNVTTITYGGVLHVLPWVSTYANFAESFNPPGAGITINGAALPPGLSEGWDFGLRFTLLKGRVSASFGKYGSTQRNNSFDNTGQTRKYANIAAANRVGDLSADGQNARGLPLVPTPTFDFQDTKGRGYEIDIVANLTSNWRLTANAGIPKNLTTNANQEQWAYLNANEAVLKQIVQDAGVIIGANNAATVDLSVPVATRSPDAAAAATAWNDIQTFKATSNPAAATYSDQPKFTANFFTDYRFSRGILKNLRIGSGVQYIGRKAIGNRGGDTIVNPANPATAIDNPAVDNTTRIFMPAYYTVTSTVGYQVRLRQGMTLDLNLRIGNVLDNDDLVYIGAGLRAPGGDISRPDRVTVPTTFLYLPPRSFVLSATLNF